MEELEANIGNAVSVVKQQAKQGCLFGHVVAVATEWETGGK